MTQLIRLSDLKPGVTGIIRDFDQSPQHTATVLRLLELGFVPLDLVMIDQPFQIATGALVASINQGAIGLGLQEAALIWVEIP